MPESLLRMARYAEQNGCPFRLASPSPSLAKIIRITRLDHRFLTIAGVDLQIGGLDAEPDLTCGPHQPKP
jgi:anti-anti-sigma regulatory factor